MKHLCLIVFVVCIARGTALSAEPLIVVDDRGGDSALPYYAALKLQPHTVTQADASLHPRQHVSEAQMLPVHSSRLSPGIELSHAITAPGLTPVFLVGDDERSRAWLQQKNHSLLKINALGFVVNVETAQALSALRALVPGLNLAPVSGDDLAQRLHLHHYPVLITATTIEQ